MAEEKPDCSELIYLKTIIKRVSARSKTEQFLTKMEKIRLDLKRASRSKIKAP
jgi:hypothetical protein